MNYVVLIGKIEGVNKDMVDYMPWTEANQTFFEELEHGMLYDEKYTLFDHYGHRTREDIA